MLSKRRKIIVVGAGLSGSMATIYAAGAGVEVTLISSDHPHRSSSSCLKEGISSSIAPYTLEQHISDSTECTGSIANKSQISSMCEASPGIVNLLERMGVIFDRDVEGYIKVRHGPSYLTDGMVKAGSRTAQRILAVLNGQLRRYAASEKITMNIGWEFLSPILDDEGKCRGVVAINLKSMEIKSFRADAVIICSGGYSGIFKNTTRSSANDGSAVVSCFRSGAAMADPEFVEFYPYTFKAFGKNFPVDSHLITPEGNVVEEFLTDEAISILKLYEEATGLDPRGSPMIFEPAATYSLGGLWVDDEHMTTVSGLYAAGEAAHAYHGSGILPGNKILSSIYGGMVAGKTAAIYAKASKPIPEEELLKILERDKSGQEMMNSSIATREGTENVHNIVRELSNVMSDSLGPKRSNDKVEATRCEIEKMRERFDSAPLLDRSEWANGEIIFMRRLSNRFELSRMMADSILNRNDSNRNVILKIFNDGDKFKFACGDESVT